MGSRVCLNGFSKSSLGVSICTVCNRMLKEVGVYFICLQKEGCVKYSLDEIVNVSFKKILGYL